MELKEPDPELTRVILIAHFRADLRSFEHESELIARQWHLTSQRYLLLLSVKGAPDGSERASPTSIARRLHISTNTASEHCSRAEKDGLLRRDSDELDARVVYFSLTEEGERRLLGAIRASEANRRTLMHAFERLTGSFHDVTRPRRRRPAG